MDEKKIKVLMADDEEDILHVMAKKLAEDDYDVIKASDGAMAWEKIVSEEPDIILLDLNMPQRDGFDILKELRETPPFEKWVPVIIISARTEMEDLKQGFELEADHYITKPCNIEDIRKALRMMLSLIPQRSQTME